ncbi:MAG: hypothetical protein C0507_10295 [Cyanobacteria bacterium PR.3.49]|nr:hypothetical protein [Cyanobacteria bacterium PR.3.49]
MKLKQSISIVIALPLLFLFVVCGTVYFHSVQLDEQFSEQQKLSQAVAACQSYTSLMIRAGATLSKIGNDKSKTKFTGYRDHFKEIESGNEQLKRIAELVPSEKAAVESILSTDDEFRSLARELVAITSSHKGKHRDSRSVITVFELIDHTRKRFSILKEMQARLLQQYSESVKNGDKLKTQFDIFSFVLLASCIAAVLTFAAALFVQRRVIHRLNILALNTRRFMTQKAPVARLEGNDEVARVDRALHAMVAETNEILKRERAVIDRTKAAIFSADESFTIQTQSPSCSQLWSKQAAVGATRLSRLFEQQAWEIIEQQLLLARKEDYAANFTVRLSDSQSDGLPRTFFSSVAWNKVEKKYFCTFTDISESERKRDEIRSREEKIRALMELMPSALLLLDNDGCIRMCNAAASQIFSQSMQELVGKPILQFLSLSSGSGSAANLLEFCKGKVTEATLTNSHNTSVQTQMTADNFDSSSWLVVLIDVSERHKLEEARRNIVSVIAHDIRTPLTSMLANVDLLLSMGDRRPDVSQNQEIISVRKTCKVLTALISELLTMQRFGQPGAAVQSFKLCTLEDLLDESVEACFDASIAAGVAVDSETTKETVSIDIERSQLCIIKLLRLLILFAKKGSLITIGGALVDRAGETTFDVKFEVTDQASKHVSLQDFLNAKRPPDEAVEISVLNILVRNLGANLIFSGHAMNLQLPVLRSILFETSIPNESSVFQTQENS